jgi:hypothetical protein
MHFLKLVLPPECKLIQPGQATTNKEPHLCAAESLSVPAPVTLWRSAHRITNIQTMADIKIKPDPEAQGASPAALSDEDMYEDAGDLEFNTSNEFQSLYHAKVPKYMWDAWEKLDDDAEIQIGTIRQTKVIKDGVEQV